MANKSFRRILSLSLLVFMVLSMTLVYAEGQSVVDEANLLDGTTEQTLETQAKYIVDTYKMEPVVVTTNNSEGKSWMAYADDYYDYNGYGVGSENEGILLLIDMGTDDGNRGYWISTTGSRTISKYENQIEKMKEVVLKYLKKGDYDRACLEFMNMVENMEASGKPYTFGQRLMGMVTSWIPYVVALAIGAIATGILTLQSKSKVTASGRNYEEPGSFKLEREVDRFEHEHTTRRAIPKNNSSGGGGGSHTGSSGTSHGGGGGGF